MNATTKDFKPYPYETLERALERYMLESGAEAKIVEDCDGVPRYRFKRGELYAAIDLLRPFYYHVA